MNLKIKNNEKTRRLLYARGFTNRNTDLLVNFY